jgi:hypothetical protein
MFKLFNSSSSSSSSKKDAHITNNNNNNNKHITLHKHMFITQTLPSSSISALHNKKTHRTHLSIF